MSLFLISYFTVYGLMHAYAFLKARGAIAFGLRPGLVLAAFMILMILAPIIMRNLERAGYEQPARVLAHIGYAWMGLMLLFAASGAALDAYYLICKALSAMKISFADKITPDSKAAFYIPLVIALAAGAYGAFEASDIRVERVAIKTAKLALGSKIKIAQISDVHLGLMFGPRRLRPVIDMLNAESPDVIIASGDIIDGVTDGLGEARPMLAALNPPLGKFAVLGNHEYYAGLEGAEKFLSESGFVLLRNDAVTAGGINLAGTDYPYFKNNGQLEAEMMERLDKGRFTVLIRHVPDLEPALNGTFDLQLSGHTHGGQIFPFGFPVRLVYPNLQGRFDLADGGMLYVSRGTGFWGPPMRVLTPPEITVFDISPK